ncbi:MAG TPA: hypothetical protein VJU16_05885 [Planctomycetota bacterium]|nr:hypothetical protein [Planctomycetota bacterium]
MESTDRRRRPIWLVGLAVLAVVAGLAAFRAVRSYKIQGDIQRLKLAGAHVYRDNWQFDFGGGDTIAGVFSDVPYVVIVRSRTVSPGLFEILNRLPRVVRLVFESCELPPDVEPIRRMPKLDELEFSQTRVTVDQLASLGPGSGIRRLKLLPWWFEGPDLAVLSSWPGLRELVLHPSEVTPATLEMARSLPHLETLFLEKRLGSRSYSGHAWDRLEGELNLERTMNRVREFSERR